MLTPVRPLPGSAPHGRSDLRQHLASLAFSFKIGASIDLIDTDPFQQGCEERRQKGASPNILQDRDEDVAPVGPGEKPSVPQHTCTWAAASANGPTGAGLMALGQCSHRTQTQVSDGAWPFPAWARELAHTNTQAHRSPRALSTPRGACARRAAACPGCVRGTRRPGSGGAPGGPGQSRGGGRGSWGHLPGQEHFSW